MSPEVNEPHPSSDEGSIDLPASSVETDQPEAELYYAWRKLAGHLTFDEIDAKYKDNPDLVLLDVCSAFPVYAEMAKNHLLTMTIDRGERVVGNFVNALNENKPLGFLTTEEEAELDEI